MISEADQKFYARDPKGKKISVFTDKENFKKAVKGGYEKVDREEAEKDNNVFHRDVLDIHTDGRGAIVSEDFG